MTSPVIDQRHFRAILTRAVAFPLILMTILAAMLLWEIQRLLSVTQWVDQADKTIAMAYNVDKLLLDMETGLRGYQLIPHPSFFEPYKRAEPLVYPSIDSLTEMVSGDPMQLSRVKAIKNSYGQWYALSKDLIARRAAGRDYLDYASNQRGDDLMDNGIRTDLTLLIESEEALRNDRTNAARRTVYEAVATALGLLALLGTAVGYFAKAQMVKVSTSYRDALEAAHEQSEELQHNSAVLRENFELLRISEERNRASFEQAAVGIADAGLGGTWLDVNRKLCEITGSAPDQLAKLTVYDVAHPDDVSSLSGVLERLLAGEQRLQRLEQRFVRADGSVVWVHLTASLIRKPTGEAYRFVFIVEDVTERREMEHALRNSEERYRELFENANDVVYTLDLTGRITSINKAAERMVRYPIAELVGMKISELIAPDYRESASAISGNLLGAGQHWKMEFEFVTKDGDPVPVEVNNRVVSENGQPCAIQGIARDVSERKQMIQALRTSEAHYRTLFEKANDSILVIDADDASILAANERASELYGFTRAELVGMKMAALTGDMRATGVAAGIDGVETETVHHGRDGAPIHLLASSSAIHYGGKPALLTIYRNVTGRKLEEEAKQKSLAGFSDFVSAVAAGDLTRRGSEGPDSIGAATLVVNRMLSGFNAAVVKVKNLAVLVSSGAEEILSASQRMSEGTELQSREFRVTAAQTSAMARSISQISLHAQTSAGVALQALAAAERGDRSVR
ncbi:MAG TPA: PAS domain S-box protein, partial [Blastocatellia bacterium]|nr:PAS domain S-box protein [Blastocatellia bacterium]